MKRPSLKKVDINELIDTMMELWTSGVDYVDIIINPKDNTLSLTFTEDYISEDAIESLSDDDENISEVKIEIKSKLTDDDLNQLI
jgi:hypothetical protein